MGIGIPLFFHQKTITRRARNRINAIKDDRDIWLYDTNDIKSHAVYVFSILYKSDQDLHRPYTVQGFFPKLITIGCQFLLARLTTRKFVRRSFR